MERAPTSSPTSGDVLTVEGVRWHVAPAARERVAAWLGADASAARVYKDADGTRVTARDGIVRKERRLPPGRSRLRFGLRRSAARRAFHLGRALLAAGIDTPAPLAWAVRRRHGLRIADLLLVEHVEDARRLEAVLASAPRDAARRARLVEALGRLVASFHESGFVNRDLKATNVLVRETPDTPALVVVDLDAVRPRARITARDVREDLDAILVSLGRYGVAAPGEAAALRAAYDAGRRS